MRERHAGGRDRHFHKSDDQSDHHHHHHGEHGELHGRHRRGRHGGRLFDYGDLRLLLLAMIAEKSRHGYELIKAIEERFGGSYTPSPGVIYPTLAWLDDMGYAAIEAEAGRKSYRITAEGEAFLTANRAAADALLSRTDTDSPRSTNDVPTPVVRAFENLKVAMRLRLRRGALDDAAAQNIAAALDAAAQTVERS